MRTKLLLALTLMAAGRAMTLGWVARAGDGGPGDPPAAWLLPLLGDAFIGLSALAVAGLLLFRPSPLSWLIAVVWNALAIFDALAAYIVETQSPWPEFFMLELFGRSMFAMAIGLHLAIAVLHFSADVRSTNGINQFVPDAELLLPQGE